MKRSFLALIFFFAPFFMVVACAPSSPCHPVCGTGTVCIAEGNTPSCKKSCDKNEDCGKGEECHKDEDLPHHCDVAD